MASSTVERLLVSIEANAAQLQAELAKGAQATKTFGTSVGQAQAQVGGLGQRYANAGLQIASAAENMARAGKVGGDGLKQIISQGSQAALLFGPQGALVGSIGIAGLAIVEIFRRTSAETRALLEELEDRARGGADAIRLELVRTSRAALEAERDRAAARRTFGGASGQDAAAPDTAAVTEANRQIQLLIAEERRLLEGRASVRQRDFEDEVRRLVRLRDENVLTIAQKQRLATIEQSIAANIRNATRLQGQGTPEQQKATTTFLLNQLDLYRAINKETGKTTKSPLAELAKGGGATLAEANAQLDAFSAKRESTQKELARLLQNADRDLLEFTGDAVALLDAQIAEAVAQARALGATDADIARIVRPLQLARDAALATVTAFKKIEIPPSVQAQLQASSNATNASIAQQQQADRDKAAAKVQELRDGLSDAVSVGAGLATVLFGAEAPLTRLIGGVGQLVDGFGQIAVLAAKKEGGLSALFSSGAGIASALPGIGAAIAGAGAFLSATGIGAGESAAQKALRQSLDNNAKRLVELKAGIDALALSITGSEAAAVRDVAIRDIRPGDLLNGTSPIAEVLADLRKAGVSLEELRKVARDFGIDLAQSPTIGQLRALQEAIKTFSLEKLLKSLDGQLKLLDLRQRIDPAAFEGLAGVLAKLEIFSGVNGGKGIPAITEALKGLDPKAPDFAAQAIERLKALFANVGKLDLADFGDIDPAELPAILAELIEALQKTLPKIKSAAELFNEAMGEVSILVEFGLLDGADAILKATIGAFKNAFKGFEGFLDFSSLEAFEESAKKLLEIFLLDDELSDEELAVIEGIRKVREAFKKGAPEATVFTDALSALLDAFEILGVSAKDQVTQLLAAFTSTDSIAKNSSFSLLQGLLDGLDTSSPEGLAELRRRAGEILAALSEGGITEQEQAVIDAIKRILGAADKAVSEAEREADAAAAARAARRKAILDRAEDRIRLEDVTDPAEQLRIRLAAVAEAFPELSEQLAAFDVSTQAGRDALEAWIRGLAGSPEQLEALADATGVSVEALLQAFFSLEDGADAAKEAVQTLADTLRAAFEDLDFDLALEGITDPLDKLVRTARTVGKAIPAIAELLESFDLNTESGRKGAEAALIELGKTTTDQATRQAILRILESIRAVNVDGAAPGDTASAGGGAAGVGAGNSLTSGIDALSEITGLRIEGWLAQLVAETRDQTFILERALSPLSSPAPVLSAPAVTFSRSALPSGTPFATGGDTWVIELNIGTVNARDGQEFGQIALQELRRGLGSTFAMEARLSARRRGNIAVAQ